MSLNTDYRTPAQLTAAARDAAQTVAQGVNGNGLLLEPFMPSVQNTTLAYEFDGSGSQNIGSAEFRSFDAEAPYGATSSSITKSGKLPPISKKLPISELSELQLMNQVDAIGAKEEEHARSLGQQIATRAELARGEALETGKLTLSENGLVAEVDFGRQADHTVTAGTKWDQTGATPIDDLQSWIDVFVAGAGTAPGTLVISRKILATLAKNSDLIQAAVRSSGAPSRVSYDDVKSVLNSYGIDNTVVFDESYLKGGALTRVVSQEVALLLPDPGSAPIVGGVLGTTQYGVPAEAIQPSYGIPAGEQAGIFAGAFSRTDPVGLNVLISAIMLPVLANANASMAATVL